MAEPRQYTHEECSHCNGIGRVPMGEHTRAFKKCLRCHGNGFVKIPAPADKDMQDAKDKLAGLLADMDKLT